MAILKELYIQCWFYNLMRGYIFPKKTRKISPILYALLQGDPDTSSLVPHPPKSGWALALTARRSNQSILKEISPEYSLEGLMLKLKLKLQYCGHLMQRTDSLEKTLMLGKSEGGRRMGRQRMKLLDGITDSIDTSLSKSGSWWWTGKPGVVQSMGSQSVGHDWATELDWTEVSSEGSVGLIIWDGAPTRKMVEVNYWPRAQGGLLAWHPICGLSLWLSLIMCSWCPRMSVLKAESGIWPDLGFIQTGTWSLPLYCMGQIDSQESSPIPQFKSINSSALKFLCSSTLISIHDYWKNHSFD